ncbi:hypothetical protein [Bacillus sp. SD088]|uniref:hypothetical protein n=1 Tax=Bacillus sp. SD088 TaxID=2782012 RepID=UPI001A97D02B|nr:hypothetical protein [Bacillus sp. SD088]MBO0995234.1 hypothetical protein [Bacillus sp. SD088]
MKKIIAVFASLIILYSVYHDLTVGVLPAISANSTIQEDTSIPKEKEEKMFTETIQPGDTVLSILETHQQGALPVAIEQIVTDFEQLNNGVKPEQIQIGKTYTFPIYSEVTD